MLTKSGNERIAGVLLILIVVAFAVSIGTFVDVDLDRADIRESLQEVDDDLELYTTSWSFNLAGGLLLVAAAGALYLVFRSHERSLALFSLVALLAAGVAFAVATASFFGLSFLAQDFVDTSGAEASALAGTARAVGLAGFSAYFTALTLTGAGALPLGVLIVWSKAVPDWLGWPAVFSAILMLLSWLIFAPSVAGLIIAAIGGLGTLLFFLILGIWLLVRGTRDVRTV